MALLLTELSCYMENKPGILSQVAQGLADISVNIRGIQCLEGQVQSIVRLVVDPENVDAAEKVLRDFGVELISRPEIIEVVIKDDVGGLAAVTTQLGKAGLNILSFYACGTPTSDECAAFLRVDDVEKGLRVLEEIGL